MSRPGDTRPFAAFEWRLASRYLRPRRSEGFISVTAGFSIAGIMIGVAALIAVTSVMNGFRSELFSKTMGLNGHAVAVRIGEAFTDYEDAAAKVATVPGVTAALPLIEGQVLVSAATGGFVGVLAWLFVGSLGAAAVIGVLVFLISAFIDLIPSGGSRGTRGGWSSGGSSDWSSGRSSSSDSGGFSGGGGSFGGGGASGSW